MTHASSIAAGGDRGDGPAGRRGGGAGRIGHLLPARAQRRAQGRVRGRPGATITRPSAAARDRQRLAAGLAGGQRRCWARGALIEWLLTAPRSRRARGLGGARGGSDCGGASDARAGVWPRLIAAGRAGCSDIPFYCSTDEQCVRDGERRLVREGPPLQLRGRGGCPSGRRYAPFGTGEACVPAPPACAVAGRGRGRQLHLRLVQRRAGVLLGRERQRPARRRHHRLRARPPARSPLSNVVEVVAGLHPRLRPPRRRRRQLLGRQRRPAARPGRRHHRQPQHAGQAAHHRRRGRAGRRRPPHLRPAQRRHRSRCWGRNNQRPARRRHHHQPRDAPPR